jgi:hypothetical protein
MEFISNIGIIHEDVVIRLFLRSFERNARNGLNILVEEKYHLLQVLLRHFARNGALMIMRNGCPMLKISRKCMV